MINQQFPLRSECWGKGWEKYQPQGSRLKLSRLEPTGLQMGSEGSRQNSFQLLFFILQNNPKVLSDTKDKLSILGSRILKAFGFLFS